MKKSRIIATLLVVLMASAVLVVPVLAANPSGTVNGAFTGGNPSQVTPTVTAPANQNANPTVAGTTTVNFQVTATDTGGTNYLGTMTATLKGADDTSYGSAITVPTGTSTGAPANSLIYSVNVPMSYYWTPQVYTVTFTVQNVAQTLTSAPVTSTITYNSALGLTVQTPSVNFGTVFANAQQTASQSVTVQNTANTPLHISAQDTGFYDANYVLDGSQVALNPSVMYGSMNNAAFTQLSSNPTTATQIGSQTVPIGNGATAPAYFALNVPTNNVITSGSTWTNTITLTGTV